MYRAGKSCPHVMASHRDHVQFGKGHEQKPGGQVIRYLRHISSRLVMQSQTRLCEALSPAIVGIALQLLHFSVCMHSLQSARVAEVDTK